MQFKLCNSTPEYTNISLSINIVTAVPLNFKSNLQAGIKNCYSVKLQDDVIVRQESLLVTRNDECQLSLKNLVLKELTKLSPQFNRDQSYGGV